ncbi:putative proton-dependent oligopeptide transporter family, major facilitator superfamily [Rosa chinensis]|uniref:Putative proton-dependent oligopeptide transporter family, major facilitator superfamily n=1 Tax=Rosa chinensis TaxID=74649 RepID=A0A2P6S9Q0_ROSCH|nr:protein NRT1/ PTR FAMILY 5.4 [Rosa chinensis]PRQ55392.1 putative proton-dependent oligopeptide transporter family, major facilitator superfamily [Rosa chinensis]
MTLGNNERELLVKMLSSDHQKTPSRGGWNAAIFIIFVEVAERFAYYGLIGNLIMYLTNELHQPTAAAAKNVNLWIGLSSLFPILGAIVADSYLGRFKTIIYSTCIYFLGMVMLCLSASVVPRQYREGAYFVGLYILAVGEGGHKPCVQTFAADQFEEETDEDKEAKSSFFNWWYLAIVVTATAATLGIIYIQDNVSWVLSYSVLAVVIAAGLLLFVLGIRRYRNDDNLLGSPFTTVAQVFVAAAWKCRVKTGRRNDVVYYGDDEGESSGVHSKHKTLANTKQFRFLDKAMIIDEHDASSKMRNPWRLCSLNQVEEVKLVVRLIPIWLSCLMFHAVQSQLHTYFIKQGSTMIRSIGPNFRFPPASLQALVGIVIVTTVPIYDRILVPTVRKFTGHPAGITVLQRIGVGLFLSIINMVVAALVEAKRVGVAREYNLMDNPKAMVPISVWWLLPQYFITGLSDAFTVIGLQELFYDQMPDAMRSLGAAAYISILGVGSFLSSFIISLVETITRNSGEPWLGNNLNRAHLDDFYWVLAGLSALFFGVYVWVAKRFVYKKVVGEASSGEV